MVDRKLEGEENEAVTVSDRRIRRDPDHKVVTVEQRKKFQFTDDKRKDPISLTPTVTLPDPISLTPTVTLLDISLCKIFILYIFATMDIDEQMPPQFLLDVWLQSQ
jgi:hypothetical protein